MLVTSRDLTFCVLKQGLTALVAASSAEIRLEGTLMERVAKGDACSSMDAQCLLLGLGLEALPHSGSVPRDGYPHVLAAVVCSSLRMVNKSRLGMLLAAA